MIIQDTREKKPLWNPLKFKVKMLKLGEGDYTTDELLNVAHIERKSGIDLYGSIIQGHERFKRELQRAIAKNIKLAIFVECLSETFYEKKFKRGYKLKAPSSTLRKIVKTISERYCVEFVWCKNRKDLRNKMCFWFVRHTK